MCQIGGHGHTFAQTVEHVFVVDDAADEVTGSRRGTLGIGVFGRERDGLVVRNAEVAGLGHALAGSKPRADLIVATTRSLPRAIGGTVVDGRPRRSSPAPA